MKNLVLGAWNTSQTLIPEALQPSTLSPAGWDLSHFSLLGVQTNAWLFCIYYCYKSTSLYQSKNVSYTVTMYQIKNMNSFFTISKDL